MNMYIVGTIRSVLRPTRIALGPLFCGRFDEISILRGVYEMEGGMFLCDHSYSSGSKSNLREQ